MKSQAHYENPGVDKSMTHSPPNAGQKLAQNSPESNRIEADMLPTFPGVLGKSACVKRKVPQAPRDLLYKKLTRQHHSAQKQTSYSETRAKIRGIWYREQAKMFSPVLASGRAKIN